MLELDEVNNNKNESNDNSQQETRNKTKDSRNRDQFDVDYNLFQMSLGLWGTSLLAPTCTNLRILARKGLLSDEEDAQRILNTPFSVEDMIDIVLKNKDTMSKEFEDDPGVPFHITLTELYKEKFKLGHESDIVVFEDTKTESELVYGIVVNRHRKRTAITFRGSVSKRDYQADTKIRMRSMRDSEGNLIRVHKGLADYLYGPDINSKSKRHQKQEEDDSYTSKYDEIVQKLKEVYEQYPDHQLYVTGHSLGGSLAILTSFRLATDPIATQFLPQSRHYPIITYVFGAFLVGDLRFLRSFQTLENNQKIQCCNILNEGDIIPLIPVISGWALYRSVGNVVTLRDSKKRKKNKKPVVYTPPQSWFPRNHLGEISIPGYQGLQFMYILGFKRKFWFNHSVSTTMANIINSEQHLKQRKIQDFYLSA